MTIDRELLELAAKAAGIELKWNGTDAPWCFAETLAGVKWDPLTDDGDALRLAVKLRLTVGCPGVARDANGATQFVSEETEQDDFAATRRAIVRAAAEVGRGMK